MSEKMTKDDADRTMSIGRANAWGREVRLAALEDWKRARASEDQKDSVIKALADALEANGERRGSDWHTTLCWQKRTDGCTKTCAAERAALRLAGRLP